MTESPLVLALYRIEGGGRCGVSSLTQSQRLAKKTIAVQNKFRIQMNIFFLKKVSIS